jgi:DNA-binding transcriptional regulator PaaX
MIGGKMKAAWLHHPQFCPRVLARRVTDEVLDLVFLLGRVVAVRGRYFPLARGFKTNTYFMAAHRLRRQGLVVQTDLLGKTRRLTLAPAGLRRVSATLQPERWWRQSWPGRWYVLVYDIPEIQHGYRKVLRFHLKQLRMGNLQGSVWLSARDIRHDFDDLSRAAGLSEYAFLFEAQTVLGQSGPALAAAAWDFHQLHQAHTWFLAALAETRQQLSAGSWAADKLLALLREQQSAYLTVMEADPLLPAELWPDNYLGPQVYQAHAALARQIISRL